ncbi:MAG: FAD-dependent oxidoreductase [Bifidobacteriaceae bacterium]|jgi:electron transfer flavoprotein-quinone oxidoreductase|nr:FAD-dependent oxidoreductase [Bifidobacteriaceae bacterium]
MSAEVDFDVIVIGCGPAGAITAYQLAKAGRSVAVIERGETPGSKNLSGGIMYCHAIKQVFPNFLTDAPVERLISRNALVFTNPSSHVAIDYGDDRLHAAGTAVTVLRARLDGWLAEQCEAVGAMVMPGLRVDGLVRAGGRVAGVVAGEDELRSHVVVAADGVNSFIARGAGLRPKPPPEQLALGIKAVVKLSQEIIADRFQLSGDQGAALAMVGAVTDGIASGAFLYTNRESLSLGLVLRLDDLTAQGGDSSALFERFLAHRFVAPLIEGGRLIEYGSHLVNEGGQAMIGNLVFDGLVIVGDAAGLTINTGLTVRGMDLAVGSGIAAARGIERALEAGDYSAGGLDGYRLALAESFVGRDMKTFAKAPRFMENHRLYGDYGALLADIFHGVYNLDLAPRRRMVSLGRQVLRDSPVSLRDLVGDGLRAVTAL